MFVKLTRKDGTAIWVNTNFIVTVEPVKGGGSIVVPFGDGLDYEVRESVDKVLAAIDGTQVEEDVPEVSASDAPADTPDDVPEAVDEEEEAKPEDSTAETPAFEPVATDASISEAEAAAGVAAVAALTESQEEPDPKATRRARKAKAKPAKPGTPATEGERKMPSRRRSVRKTPLELSDEQLSRLRKMAPRSVKKLTNVLKEKQFDSSDPEKMIKALVEHNIISVDDQTQHVEWLVPQTA